MVRGFIQSLASNIKSKLECMKALSKDGDRKQRPPKHAFTVTEYADFSGMTRNGADDALRSKARNGELCSKKFYEGSRWVNFYWLDK